MLPPLFKVRTTSPVEFLRSRAVIGFIARLGSVPDALDRARGGARLTRHFMFIIATSHDSIKADHFGSQNHAHELTFGSSSRQVMSRPRNALLTASDLV